MRYLVVSVVLLAAVAGVALAQSTKSSSRLEDAYKREFAFLESEKRTLQARLEEERRSGAAKIDKARGETAALQGKVVALAGEAERLEELLLAAERDLDTMEQSEDVGEDLMARASAAFSKVGIELPEADLADRAQLLAQLAFVFGTAPEVLARQSAIRTEDGSYFDAVGVKVTGRILRVGDIAAYGLVDGAMGPLAPAGEGLLKLWPADGAADAAAQLAAGGRPGTLPMFLYESLDKGVERKASKSVVEVIETGGVIGWVIVGLGLAALAMIVARFGLLLWASRGGRRLIAPVLAALERGERGRARELAARSSSPTGRVMTATLDNLDKDRGQLEDVVAEAVLQEQPHLSRFGSSILVMAAVSPLLGLLGTVTGMISTFDVITEYGTGNPKMLSGGISEALVTTELGLIVAIPALLLGHLLTGWAERIRDGLDGSALAAVNRAAGLTPPDEREVEEADEIAA